MLNSATNPKWYECIEKIIRCDIADPEREVVELGDRLKSGRISSSSWKDWQRMLIEDKRTTRKVLNATIAAGVELGREKRVDSNAKRRPRTSSSSCCSTDSTRQRSTTTKT